MTHPTPAALRETPPCDAQSEGGYLCELPAGHDGPHRVEFGVDEFGPIPDLEWPAVPLHTQSKERTMELGEFHNRDGWYFKRLDDGSVRIRKTASSHAHSTTAVEHIIPPNEWVSIVAHVSGEHMPIEERYGSAARLHNTNEPRHD